MRRVVANERNLTRDPAAMDLETLWYEAFPYLYGIGGVVAILLPTGSGLLKGSGVLLIAASLTILRMRWVHRREEFRRTPTSASVRVSPTAED